MTADLLLTPPNDREISPSPLRPPAPQPIQKLHVRHLSVFYGDQCAVDDVSLPVYENRVTALIGPSGCGKSTLLRALNRMHELYRSQRVEGEVLLNGENMLRVGLKAHSVRARIGMVFQTPIPFPMSIYNNVAFGPRLYRTYSKSEMDDVVEDALRRAALWGEVKDTLRQSGLALSGGQQQRLCIARAIALRPEVLLLDEPCSALDPGSAAQIEDSISRLKLDCTIMIVTHNMQQAARVSDFTAFMYLGRLIEFGPTHEIFSAPREPQTKAFVGGKFG